MNEREGAAYHEAAHAVAYTRFGSGCGLVTIVENLDENSAGSTTSMECTDHDSIDDTAVTRHVIALLAGYVAGVEHDASVEEVAALGARSDFEKAKELLRRSGLRQDLRPWLVEARQFVRKEWPAIEMIARELLEVNSLDDAEVDCILDIVDGNTESLAHLAQHRVLMGRNPTRQFPFRIQRTASPDSGASSGLDHL